MATTYEFQRARRPEHKEERREAILAAARELAGERPVREISLGDIARRVGLAKSNLLRYFESREDVFLRLLLREWESWRVSLTTRLRSGGATADDVAATIARTIAERPLFCDLISEMSAVLERNVSVATVQAFKSQSLDKVDDLGAVVTERIPDLDSPHGRETIAAALIITAGLWPIANPAPHVTAMYAEDPALTRAHLDFEDHLRQLLSALITGFLNTQTTKPRKPAAVRSDPPKAPQGGGVMTFSRQEIVEMLRRAGMEDAAAAALGTLPDQMDGKAVEKFCAAYGLTLESLVDRMGGSP